MKRVITLTILIIINFLIQSTVFGGYNASGITANFMLILTMSFGLMRGRKEGLLVGFFCGFLADLFFSTVLGPYMFLYMILGYTNGFFHKNYKIEDIVLPLIVIIVDEFIFNIIVYVFSFVLYNKLDFGKYLTKIILPEILITAFLTIILYKLYVKINKLLKSEIEGDEV